MERKRKMLIKTSLLLYKEKLQKKLEREQKNLDKFLENNRHLPPRKGVRGGRNTSIQARIASKFEVLKTLKMYLDILEEEISKY